MCLWSLCTVPLMAQANNLYLFEIVNIIFEVHIGTLIHTLSAQKYMHTYITTF